ncbi:response regulator [Gluconobacter sphaericus]|uniref:Two-component response regulator n=1 Tax=Gluconobacter sphaericus NBRC 12467 TaxID=1307951 RepID=A0AA37SJJ1_9PROT|nr:response regulator [Gluconobacter sphaericus]MBF0885388.1 response regulator [Gluconobacter sphaericus]QQX91061.1 response regulator [Gluconobacter sphaericus]GBR56202.1 two-component response regulator [Gluconobacter sphaericus NBRC 12467]GEB42036.1 two-component response regulator [Gluconobacter sphaericus NBRC 12467]GLQ84597.1 two-component response regulator [Gluconobacter sphaericus NBRC 12467]
MTDLTRQELVKPLPYARRFARALVGDQKAGDELVGVALKELMENPSGKDLSARQALYGLLVNAFMQRHSKDATAGMPLRQRALLLLTSLEEQSLSSSAQALGITDEEAAADLNKAREGLQGIAQTSVLIIEDEPIIAMDIQDLVERCGHRIAGVAHTEADAVALAAKMKPGLILADINLGGGGDGMQAVGRILRTHEAPVIFVTAYPERLLTGETQEPSFVITKPFEPMTLAVATYQAVTGGVTPV